MGAVPVGAHPGHRACHLVRPFLPSREAYRLTVQELLYPHLDPVTLLWCSLVVSFTRNNAVMTLHNMIYA